MQLIGTMREPARGIKKVNQVAQFRFIEIKSNLKRKKTLWNKSRL